MQKVLLTGITGFLGSRTAIQLLNKGYHVTGTLRNKDRAESIKTIVSTHTENIENLELIQADLIDDRWGDRMAGIDYVMHIASPFPRTLPKHEDDLIIPAKKGALNIIQAASKKSVKRVVMTSSSGAITYGVSKHKTFNEEDWTDVTNKKDTTPYFRSKTIAEKAAWDFIKSNDSDLELTVINPSLITGPIIEKDYGTSGELIKKMIEGSMPALPDIGFPTIDVRSVAEAHILAMETKAAAGERIICSGEYYTVSDIASIIRPLYPNLKIPKSKLPNFGVKIFALFDKEARTILLDLGTRRKLDNSKARQLLGWEPMDGKEGVISMAKSMIEHGVVS
ncbi:MAG: aldehyde reductase [Saprospiraceae bacterium]|nr:aldehyde reductase [Saprospiraceae bacterium]